MSIRIQTSFARLLFQVLLCLFFHFSKATLDDLSVALSNWDAWLQPRIPIIEEENSRLEAFENAWGSEGEEAGELKWLESSAKLKEDDFLSVLNYFQVKVNEAVAALDQSTVTPQIQQVLFYWSESLGRFQDFRKKVNTTEADVRKIRRQRKQLWDSRNFFWDVQLVLLGELQNLMTGVSRQEARAELASWAISCEQLFVAEQEAWLSFEALEDSRDAFVAVMDRVDGEFPGKIESIVASLHLAEDRWNAELARVAELENSRNAERAITALETLKQDIIGIYVISMRAKMNSWANFRFAEEELADVQARVVESVNAGNFSEIPGLLEKYEIAAEVCRAEAVNAQFAFDKFASVHSHVIAKVEEDLNGSLVERKRRAFLFDSDPFVADDTGMSPAVALHLGRLMMEGADDMGISAGNWIGGEWVHLV